MPNTNPENLNRLLAIGRLGSPHGVHGFIRVQSYSGETGHFASLGEVLLVREAERRTMCVEETKIAGSDIYLKLAGCAGPEEARLWTGWEILVPRTSAALLGPGEYYATDLSGCDLKLAGRSVGTVLSVVEGGGGSLLEVRTEGGKTVLVPFRGEFVGDVDIPSRTLELLVGWILE